MISNIYSIHDQIFLKNVINYTHINNTIQLLCKVKKESMNHLMNVNVSGIINFTRIQYEVFVILKDLKLYATEILSTFLFTHLNYRED